MASESITKTIGVVVAICFVAAIFVSSAAVGLKPIQEENKKIDLLKNILIAGDLYKSDDIDVNDVFNKNIVGEIVNLENGSIIPESQYDDVLNLKDFDVKILANSSKYGKSIPPNKDIAGIRRMPKDMAVYKVVKDGEVQKYIFPIYGKGLWSTMYGFIALSKDLHTIEGFTFYEHGETPGLGGEIDNPKWKHLWVGKHAFDDNWNLKIRVLKGKADRNSSNFKYEIDGLSGATLTTRGVDNLVKFWLSDTGYKQFIEKLSKENTNEKI